MKVWLARCTVVKAIPFKLLNFVLLTEIYCVTAAPISSFRARKKSAASASSGSATRGSSGVSSNFAWTALINSSNVCSLARLDRRGGSGGKGGARTR